MYTIIVHDNSLSLQYSKYYVSIINYYHSLNHILLIELILELNCIMVRWLFKKNYITFSANRDKYNLMSNSHATVEPLTNDHPHQRPSLSNDHISCDGQWFLFVYESLTSDHPSYTTTPM